MALPLLSQFYALNDFVPLSRRDEASMSLEILSPTGSILHQQEALHRGQRLDWGFKVNGGFRKKPGFVGVSIWICPYRSN